MLMWSYLGTLDVEASLGGSAYAATGVAAMISPFIVGMIADRFFATQKSLSSSYTWRVFSLLSWPG